MKVAAARGRRDAGWKRGVVAFAAIAALLYFGRLPLIVLVISLMLALVLEPLVKGLLVLRLPRPFAALLVVAVLFGAVGGGTFALSSRALAFFNELPTYSSEIRAAVRKVTARAERLQKTTESVLPKKREPRTAVKLQESTSWSSIAQNISSVGEVLLAASFIPFLVYFMLSWQRHVRVATVRLFPREKRQRVDETLGLVATMTRRFILGNLLTGLLIGVVSTIVFALVGLPFFYFVGLISGFINLIPYLGVLLAPLVPLIVGIGRLSATDAAIVVVSVFALHLLTMNLVFPKLVGKSLELNPLAGTVAILLWGWFWGPMGLILGIPLTAGIKIVLDHTERYAPVGGWLGLETPEPSRVDVEAPPRAVG